MKKSTLLALLYFVVLTLISISVNAQKYTLDPQGKVVSQSATVKTKTPDKVYQIVDGVTFYQGAKGSIYCLKTSKKTGKIYKSYVSKTK